MNAQIIRQANEISARASELRDRAERLLSELREFTSPAKKQGKTVVNGRIIHIVR